MAALAICADTARPSHVRGAVERGATVYLAGMFIIPSDLPDDVPRLSCHARNHAVVVAMANFGRSSGGLASAGRSGIWSPTGDLLVQLPAEGAGIAVAAGSSSGWESKGVRLG